MSKATPFIFNDETVYNSYGFRTSNEGIDLTRFASNPVMLNGHWNSNESVIGKWEGMAVDGVTLTGLPVFDVEDESAKKIAGKVERGFLKACSMGLIFNPRNIELEPNGKWLLAACELLEVSIVPVPSNANAIRLYVEKDGKYELMKEDEVKLCLTALEPETNFEHKKNQMKKVFLSVAALVALSLDKKVPNPADGIDSADVEDAINGLKSKLDSAELKLGATESALKKYTDAEAARLDADVTAFLDEVIPAKYDETERGSITKLAKSDLGFARKMAALVPIKAGLAGKVNNPATPGDDKIKTMDDFQKLGDTAQLAYKTTNPEAYKKLVAEM